MSIKLVISHPTRHCCFLFSLMALYCGYLIEHFSSLSYHHHILIIHLMTWIRFQNQDTSEFNNILTWSDTFQVKHVLLIGQVIHRTKRYLNIQSFINWAIQEYNEKQHQHERFLQSLWNQCTKSIKWAKHSFFSIWSKFTRKLQMFGKVYLR